MQKEEMITAYELDSPDFAIPMPRSEFYKEQIAIHRSGKAPTKAVSIVDIILFDSAGELFIQKRSNKKSHNSGLFDKSIGGHVQFGDEPNYTVMMETVQELQVPSIALYSDDDFQKTFHLLHGYLDTIAVLKHISTFIDVFDKHIDGTHIPIPNKKHLYFGVYNGAVKTVDRESKGVLLYTLDDLRDEMKKTPERFTQDLHYYIKNYGKEMTSFLKNEMQMRK